MVTNGFNFQDFSTRTKLQDEFLTPSVPDYRTSIFDTNRTSNMSTAMWFLQWATKRPARQDTFPVRSCPSWIFPARQMDFFPRCQAFVREPVAYVEAEPVREPSSGVSLTGWHSTTTATTKATNSFNCNMKLFYVTPLLRLVVDQGASTTTDSGHWANWFRGGQAMWDARAGRLTGWVRRSSPCSRCVSKISMVTGDIYKYGDITMIPA